MSTITNTTTTLDTTSLLAALSVKRDANSGIYTWECPFCPVDAKTGKHIEQLSEEATPDLFAVHVSLDHAQEYHNWTRSIEGFAQYLGEENDTVTELPAVEVKEQDKPKVLHVCEGCEQEFASNKELVKHRNGDKRHPGCELYVEYKRDQAEQTFKVIAAPVEVSKPEPEPEPENVPAQAPELKCPKCGRICKAEIGLHSHVKACKAPEPVATPTRKERMDTISKLLRSLIGMKDTVIKAAKAEKQAYEDREKQLDADAKELADNWADLKEWMASVDEIITAIGQYASFSKDTDFVDGLNKVKSLIEAEIKDCAADPLFGRATKLAKAEKDRVSSRNNTVDEMVKSTNSSNGRILNDIRKAYVSEETDRLEKLVLGQRAILRRVGRDAKGKSINAEMYFGVDLAIEYGRRLGIAFKNARENGTATDKRFFANVMTEAAKDRLDHYCFYNSVSVNVDENYVDGDQIKRRSVNREIDLSVEYGEWVRTCVDLLVVFNKFHENHKDMNASQAFESKGFRGKLEDAGFKLVDEELWFEEHETFFSQHTKDGKTTYNKSSDLSSNTVAALLSKDDPYAEQSTVRVRVRK